MGHENESPDSGVHLDVNERIRSSKKSGAAEVDQEFAIFDRDGDGSIDFDEFSELVTHLGLGRGKTITRSMFDSIDSDASGRISADEFSAWWAREA